MTTNRPPTRSGSRAAAARLRVACELHDLGVWMLRSRLIRESPTLTRAELQARIVAWHAERPGAEFGDAEGLPGDASRLRDAP